MILTKIGCVPIYLVHTKNLCSLETRVAGFAGSCLFCAGSCLLFYQYIGPYQRLSQPDVLPLHTFFYIDSLILRTCDAVEEIEMNAILYSSLTIPRLKCLQNGAVLTLNFLFSHALSWGKAAVEPPNFIVAE